MTAPLLLVPDFICDARLFAPQLAAVSSRRAVQIAAPPDGETPAEMADAVLEHAPDRFALAGQGLGGMVALEVIARAADRVTRVALIGTDFLPEAPVAAAARDVQVAQAKGGQLRRIVTEDIVPAWLNGRRSPEAARALVDMAVALGPDLFVRQAGALRRRRDLSPVLETVRVPALVLVGAEDRICSVSRQQVLAARIPDATLEVVPGAAHLPTLEAADSVNRALLRWLTDALVLT